MQKKLNIDLISTLKNHIHQCCAVFKITDCLCNHKRKKPAQHDFVW